MNRVKVLGVLVCLGIVSASLGAVQQQAGGGKPMVVEVQKVRDNLFVLTGGGGNTAVFVGTKGVTVVDTKNPGWGQPVLAKIKELTNKPIVRIINTHTHGDHVSGNVEFPTNIDVITHAYTRDNMEKMKIFAENKNRGIPNRVFADYMALDDGPDRIDLRYFGRGHTSGDAWVFFPALRVVHAGDIFPGKSMPILDANNGGSGFEMPRTLFSAHAMLGDVDTIITGHSTTMTPADLQEWAQFNDDFLEAVRQAKTAGQTLENFVSTWKIPAKYTGYGEPQPARVKANAELIWKELR
jgi:glyoxylase-like metal-dependent hydrolase (beta-lactamase superfamily II)